MTSLSQRDEIFDWARVVDYSARYAHSLPQTQYELPGVTEELHEAPCAGGGDHDGVPVAVVPLWHAVETARLTVPPGDEQALHEAQRRLDAALAQVEELYPVSPAGIFVQVAWGLPYFRRYLPEALVDEPIAKSGRPGSEGEPALVEAVRFPRDPQDVVIEHNDVYLPGPTGRRRRAVRFGWPQRADAVPVPGRDRDHFGLWPEALAGDHVLPPPRLRHGRQPLRVLPGRPGEHRPPGRRRRRALGPAL